MSWGSGAAGAAAGVAAGAAAGAAAAAAAVAAPFCQCGTILVPALVPALVGLRLDQDESKSINDVDQLEKSYRISSRIVGSSCCIGPSKT